MSEPERPGRPWRRWAVAAGGLALALIAGLIALSRPSHHRPRTTTPPTSTSTSTKPPLPVAPGEQFGASVNWLFNGRNYTGGQIDAQLQALRATGATIARSDALWEATEPTPPSGGVHHYDWRFDDVIASALAEHGLRWLPIIDYTAPWAQSLPGRDHSPPASPSDFAAYAAAFALRYGRSGSFWSAHPQIPSAAVDTFEIWNEPDNPSFWTPAPDAKRYAELYTLTRSAIRMVDPAARVLIGGLTHPEVFLPAMLVAAPDLRGQIDGVAVHPYAVTPSAVLAGVRDARRTLARLSLDSVPLYVTEFGWTTSPPRVPDFLPERLRPAYITQTLAELGHSNCGVAAAVLYTWLTPERDPANKEDWFGIAPPAGGRSADVSAFADGVRQGSASGTTLPVC